MLVRYLVPRNATKELSNAMLITGLSKATLDFHVRFAKQEPLEATFRLKVTIK